MSGGQSSWVGTVRIPILNGVDIRDWSQYHIFNVNPKDQIVTWQDGQGPPGKSSPNLDATFVQGQVVAYEYTYEVYGSMTTNAYRDSWMNTYLTASQNLPGDDSYTIVTQNIKDIWQYGPSPETQVSVNGHGYPIRISYNFYSSNYIGGYYPTNMRWTMNVTIRVSSTCDQSNIHSQACIDICNLNPNLPACNFAYSQYCLKGPVANFVDPVCIGYYERYITANNSTADIDNQAINYCKRYTGFEDLLESSSNHPDAERTRDIKICACYLSAQDVPDPGATILYTRYRKSLEEQIPSIKVSSIKDKCLVPECASAAFLPADIPANHGGCPVPKCIESVTINNDGTIKHLNISQSCNTDPGDDNTLIFVFLFIITILVIAIIVYLAYAPTKLPKYYPPRYYSR